MPTSIRTRISCCLFLVFATIHQQTDAQKIGDIKEVKLDLTSAKAFEGLASFINTETKEKIVYDVIYMTNYRSEDYEKSKRTLNELFSFCMYEKNDCDFYGQQYNATLLFTSVQKDSLTEDKKWVKSSKINTWVITNLQRNLAEVRPALVYVSPMNLEDETPSDTYMYLVAGGNYFIIDTITHAETKFTKWIGKNLLCDFEAKYEYSFQGQYGKISVSDRRTYQLSKEYNLDTQTVWYKLLVQKYNKGVLVYRRTFRYDKMGKEIYDNFNTTSTKEQTLRYLNDKLGEIKGLKIGTEDNLVHEGNKFSFDSKGMLLKVTLGQNPGHKFCPPNEYETIFSNEYNFYPAEIETVKEGGTEEGRATGYFRIYFKTESCRKYEKYVSCEKKENGYKWEQSDTEKTLLKSMIVYFVRTEPGQFQQIKKAILHLRDLYN